MNKSIDEIRVSLDNKSVTSEELFKEAKTKDEQDFYMALSNIVLQKQQSKIIGK